LLGFVLLTAIAPPVAIGQSSPHGPVMAQTPMS